jgi:hypothetical protein
MQGAKQMGKKTESTIEAEAPAVSTNTSVVARMGKSDSPIGQRDPATLYRVRKSTLAFKKIGFGPFTFGQLEEKGLKPMVLLRRGEITRLREGEACSLPSTT